MKFSELWLREWVELPLDGEALCAQLSMGGLEVERREAALAPLSGVTVARVEELRPHPDAQRLQLCRIAAGGRESGEVVCGAPDVQAGVLYPFAELGAQLPGGVIRKRKIRGQVSHGMLCSAADLGLEEKSAGLLALPPDLEPGTPLAPLLGADDHCISLDLTPNRGDCLSLRGIAREVAALNGLSFTDRVPLQEHPCATERSLPVRVEAGHECPRYLGRVISGLGGGQTPLWLSERLRRAGLRSLSPIVDIGNYVMLELGQPLHAFDLAALQGGIVVRRARADETLALLDGSEIRCAQEELLITDQRGPVALAGVMGGRDSGVREPTRDIFLEAAFFTPAAVLNCARRHRLHSEAARRFERGVDPELPRLALERATTLLIECLGGEAGPVTVAETEAELPKPPEILLRRERIRSLLGVPIPDPEVERSLGLLGVLLQPDEQGWRAVPPSHRSDLQLEVDLLEELIRLYGYEKLPESRPVRSSTFPVLPRQTLPADALRRHLAALGYRESISYSLVDEQLALRIEPRHPPVLLENPIAENMGALRTSLWPGLLQVMRHNRRRQYQGMRLFEIGVCFVEKNGVLHEEKRLGMLIYGLRHEENWLYGEEKTDFYDLSGALQSLLASGGRQWRLEAGGEAAHPALHPGQNAALFYADEPHPIGVLGMIHPALAAELEVEAELGLLEVRLAPLCRLPAREFRAPVRQPALRRDLAMVVDEALPAARLLEALRESALQALAEACSSERIKSSEVLESIRLFDVYHGAGVPRGRKSLAFRIGFRHPQRSFSEAEVGAILEKVVEDLGRRFSAELRT